MKTRKLWVAIIGFGFCLVSAFINLPSQEVLSVVTADNVYGFFFDFLLAFIKTPFSWIGIVLLIIAFREPKVHQRVASNSNGDE